MRQVAEVDEQQPAAEKLENIYNVQMTTFNRSNQWFDPFPSIRNYWLNCITEWNNESVDLRYTSIKRVITAVNGWRASNKLSCNTNQEIW